MGRTFTGVTAGQHEERALKEEMIQRIMGCPSLPSLPAVAMRVLELTSQRDISMDELARTVQNDQALAAKVLKTVNSSFYGLRKRCTTINGALVMLGLSTVKSLVLGFSLVSAVGDGGDSEFDLIAYWRRGLYTAVSAKLLADRRHKAVADEAFLGGLLQDIGMMAMYRTLGKRYLRVIPICEGDHRQLVKAELAELEVQHPEIGAMLAERWKLPPELVAPIRYHERPTAAGEHAEVVRCVAAGNIVHDVLTDREPSAALRRLHAQCAAWFGMSPADCEELVKQAGAAAKEMASLFRLNTGVHAEPERILEMAQRQLKELSRTRDAGAAFGPALESLVSDGDTTDPLTGSVGRTELLRQAEELFLAAHCGGEPMAVVLVAIDAFERLVEERGAERADIALVETAALLIDRFEAEAGVVGRHGDSTFAIVLPRCAREHAVKTAGDVRRALEAASAHWGVRDGGLTVSAGAAGVEAGARPYSSIHQMFQASARAMDAARAAGGNCVRAFVPKVAA